jgi:16S rRNA (cytosine1402-N4)-methyltransferase
MTIDDPVPTTERKRRPRYSGTHPHRFGEKYKELQPERYPGIVEHVRQQGGTPAGTHVPILVAEVLAALDPKPGEVVLDCTLGAGGHASAILPKILPGGRLVGIDRDVAELERTRARLEPFAGSLSLHPVSFAWVESVAAEEGGSFDGILADLGVSSMQLDDPERGFSYKEDGPLDMRMDRSTGRTAQHLLASISEEALAGALTELADEPDAAKVAKAIVGARARKPLQRTLDLVRAVLSAKGYTLATWKARAKEGDTGLHPAARTFQAIRILVNGELDALDRLLDAAPRLLRPGGRIVILSFHSGEDRRVKIAFRDGLRGGLYEAVSEESVRSTPTATRSNPRAASARLRWARTPA